MIPKQFDTIANLGYKNLVVSGCSFTYNNHSSSACTWPFYLKDLGGFDQAIDLALPGAGNKHIANSTQWHLETGSYDVNNTLVIVMWSGNDRDDDIVSSKSLNDYPMRFYFNDDAASAISGGSGADNIGNVSKDYFKQAQVHKTPESRSVENYLYVSGLYHYLTARKFKFLFVNYLDRSIPNRTVDFDIVSYLPTALAEKYQSMFADIDNIYRWCIKRDLLAEDDFHPSPDGHLQWTQQILLPYLANHL